MVISFPGIQTTSGPEVGSFLAPSVSAVTLKLFKLLGPTDVKSCSYDGQYAFDARLTHLHLFQMRTLTFVLASASLFLRSNRSQLRGIGPTPLPHPAWLPMFLSTSGSPTLPTLVVLHPHLLLKCMCVVKI